MNDVPSGSTASIKAHRAFGPRKLCRQENFALTFTDLLKLTGSSYIIVHSILLLLFLLLLAMGCDVPTLFWSFLHPRRKERERELFDSSLGSGAF